MDPKPTMPPPLDLDNPPEIPYIPPAPAPPAPLTAAKPMPIPIDDEPIVYEITDEMRLRLINGELQRLEQSHFMHSLRLGEQEEHPHLKIDLENRIKLLRKERDLIDPKSRIIDPVLMTPPGES